MRIRRLIAPVGAAVAACAAGLGAMSSAAYAGDVNWNVSSWGHPVASIYAPGSGAWLAALEARALQISDREFQSDCHHGWTLAQIVGSRHVDRARFLAALAQLEKADLDQRVRAHQCSEQQESWILGHTRPGWDRVPADNG
jgi:hypothetical protein